MKSDKVEEADRILQSLLRENPTKSAVFQDAVSIYLYGKLYDEAINVFQLYKQNTGKDLVADFSLSSIEQEKKENEDTKIKYEQSDIKVFKCRSFWKRAKIAGLYKAFFPDYEVQTSPTGQ